MDASRGVQRPYEAAHGPFLMPRRQKATEGRGLPGALRSAWPWLQKEGYMDDWANTNGLDWCNNLLLDERSHTLDTEEVKSLAMGCTCAILQCSWGCALFHLPKFLAKTQYIWAVRVIFVKLMLLMSIFCINCFHIHSLRNLGCLLGKFLRDRSRSQPFLLHFLSPCPTSQNDCLGQPLFSASSFLLSPLCLQGPPRRDHVSFPTCHFSSWLLCISPSSDSPSVASFGFSFLLCC